MLEPLKGTEAGVGELVRNAPDAASLLRALAANADPASSPVHVVTAPSTLRRARGPPTRLDTSPPLRRGTMAGQEQVRPQRRDDGGADDAPEPRSAAAAQVQTSEIDDILDEIDGVLESNAEEFVRGFVQKGGQ